AGYAWPRRGRGPDRARASAAAIGQTAGRPARPVPGDVAGRSLRGARARRGRGRRGRAADPITFPTPRPGWYAVHVNANDVAARGATPRWFLATLLLPPTATAAGARALLDEIAAACAEVGATLVGGHTEITATVGAPVVAGCMLGTVPPGPLRRTGGGRVGDDLLLTGWLGV